MPVHKFADILFSKNTLFKHLGKLLLLVSLLSVLSFFFLDQKLTLLFASPEVASLFHAPAKAITDLGLFEYYFAMALVFWVIAKWGFPQKLDYLRRWSLNFMLALVVSGVLTHIIKFLVGRQRPHKSPEGLANIFNHLTTHWHWHSFSSGHSQVMFTAATMFCVAVPKLRWVWVPFAVLICFTRVVVRDHFLSDIIFGAFVGYAGSLLSMYIMKSKTKNSLY